MNSPIPALNGLYHSHDRRDAEIFAPIEQYHRPPSEFAHGEWHLVAEVPKIGGDGHLVRIHEIRMPARFFKVEVLDSTNSIGEATKGFALTTGSGDDMGRLCVQIALAASQGMIGLETA